VNLPGHRFISVTDAVGPIRIRHISHLERAEETAATDAWISSLTFTVYRTNFPAVQWSLDSLKLPHAIQVAWVIGMEETMKKDRRDFIKMMTAGAITASLGPMGVSGRENTAKSGTEEGPQEDRVEEALANMQKYGSCCTGVLATYSPESGIAKDLAAGLGRGMAGGIGGLGHVCGAVSGAVMVIGLKTTNKDNINDMAAGMKSMETAKKFISAFKEKHSTIMCRELIGHDISTPEGIEAAMQANAYADCPKFVATAVTILDDIFSAEK
jgi:C_GCAxxG_C_C family probable redox protein